MKIKTLSITISLLVILVFVAFAANIFSNSQKPINPNNLSGEPNVSETYGIFHKQKIAIPPQIFERKTASVLGSSDSDKRIEVDLTNQRVYVFEGDDMIYNFLVSTGKWGRTPTGEFTIWTKLRYTLMTGGSQVLGTYYYLPNVPFTMFFYNNEVSKSMGFSLHGTYWHDNFGHPMSHGCINMKTEDVEKIFYWANPELSENSSSVYASADNPGTKVVIYGEALKE